MTLSWCFPDEQTAASMRVLDELIAGDQLLVPAFWAVEVLNSLLSDERRKRITSYQTETFLADLQALNPELDSASFYRIRTEIQKLCRDYRLTPYDALYVELAKRENCPLATLDQAQLVAAKALNIECL